MGVADLGNIFSNGYRFTLVSTSSCMVFTECICLFTITSVRVDDITEKYIIIFLY